MSAVGGLFKMGFDAVKFIFKRPFQWREFLEQCWFIARVALAPTLLVAIPFTVLVSFTLNILLRELGAADLSGAGAAFGAVTQLGPLVTVLIVAGAGATVSHTAHAGVRIGGLFAQQPGCHHRHPGRLHILGVCARRQSRCVRRG